MKINIIPLTAAIIALALSLPSRAATDDKYLRSVAKKVKAIHPEMFDRETIVPDSLANGQDAVVLAELDYVNADFDEQANAHGDKTVTKRFSFVRRLVKILTPKGVEDFSQHEFGGGRRINLEWIKLADFKYGFGATIYKPDGSVVEVDLSKSFDISDGKKGNKKRGKRKTDIPGLEPGDVLDFFYSQEEWVQEFDLDYIANKIPSAHPIMNLKVEYVIHPSLTADIHALNGAPAMHRTTDKRGNIVLTADFTRVPVVTDRKFMNPDRQVPFYILSTLNYRSPYRPYSQPRSSGVSTALKGQYYIKRLVKDIFSIDASTADIVRPITNMVKDYAKAHPEASKNQLAAAAWAATHYVNRMHRDDRYSSKTLAVILAHVLANSPVEADSLGIVMINPRSQVDIYHIPSESAANFGLLANGKLFIMDSPEYYTPDEVPGDYLGESGLLYPFDKANMRIPLPTQFTASQHRPNSMVVNATLTIEDLDSIRYSGTLDLKGSMKYLAADFNSELDITRALEDILGVPDNKRFTPDNNTETPAEAEERMKDTRSDLEDILLSDHDFKISDFKITSRGLNPASPSYMISVDATAPSAVTHAGEELIIPIGKFTCSPSRLSANDRDRQTDAYLPTPNTRRVVLTLKLPEGYTAEPEAIEALSTSFANQLGSVGTQAMLQDNGSLVFVVQSRLLHAMVPVEGWQLLLDLRDAEAAVADASLILIKK